MCPTVTYAGYGLGQVAVFREISHFIPEIIAPQGFREMSHGSLLGYSFLVSTKS